MSTTLEPNVADETTANVTPENTAETPKSPKPEAPKPPVRSHVEALQQEAAAAADDTTNLMKALKAERESRKAFERELREKTAQLEKLAEVNPAEYKRLKEAAEIAERERQAAEERIGLLESRYSAQTAEAAEKAATAQAELREFQKRYALEKLFFAAGGRTDSADGVSFFDMLADRLGQSFRLESDGSVTVVDASGALVVDPETKKRVPPTEYLATLKTHPIYGTFFRGAKGSGAGLGFSGSDANGMTADDLSELSGDELFARAFG